MVEVATIEWPGQSGKKYTHWIYPLGHPMVEAGGNYVFAKLAAQNSWSPVYIGQTSNLSERFDNHHAMQCAKRNGATHIHAHKNGQEANRLAEELDLMHLWKPTCNVVGT